MVLLWSVLSLLVKAAVTAREVPDMMLFQLVSRSSREEQLPSTYTPSLMQCKATVCMETPYMDVNTYTSISMQIGQSLDKLDRTCTPQACPVAEVTGCLLRAAAHDFLDYHNCAGGADGCIDMSLPANNGIAACILTGMFDFKLQDVYYDWCQTVSLADFFVITGESVVNYTRSLYAKSPGAPANVTPTNFHNTFKYGRRTLTSCPGTTLPAASAGCTGLTSMNARLGLSWQQTTALMGGHALGKAYVANSGYDGWWSDPVNQSYFNNHYYIALMSRAWSPSRANSTSVQWNRWDSGFFAPSLLGQEMMLDTDICLAWNISGGARFYHETNTCTCLWIESTYYQATSRAAGSWCGGCTKCSNAMQHRNCCRVAGVCGNSTIGILPTNYMTGPGRASVLKYSTSDTAWLIDYQAVWIAVTTNGWIGLKSLGNTSTASATRCR